LRKKLQLNSGFRNQRIPNAAYCVDRKGAGYDLESDPEPEHAFEIFNWQLQRVDRSRIEALSKARFSKRFSASGY